MQVLQDLRILQHRDDRGREFLHVGGYARKQLFGEAVSDVCMSSTKSAIGHLLGAAGAVEAIFCTLAIRNGIVPPTLNLDDPAEEAAGVELVPHRAQERTVSQRASASSCRSGP